MISTHARAWLDDAGLLGSARVELPGGEFAVCDRVVLKLNDRRAGVENGNRGWVIAVDAAAGTLQVVLSGDRTVTLPRDYLVRRTARGEPSVVHGYAGTAHIAQGSTTDRAFVLGSDAAYCEWGYVSWSRTRRQTRFYICEPAAAERAEEHHTARGQPRQAFDEVVRTMQQSRAQRAAVDLAQRANRSEALDKQPEDLPARVAWRRARRALEEARRDLTRPAPARTGPRRHGRSI